MAYTLTVRFKDSTHHRSHHTNDTEALAALAPIVTEREAEIDHVDINPYGMDPLPPGTHVQIMERGEWAGPYVVIDAPGRTPDHIVLAGHRTYFEHYADPYNTRLAPARVTA